MSATCRCPAYTPSYYDAKGERCRDCGLYRPRAPKPEPAA